MDVTAFLRALIWVAANAIAWPPLFRWLSTRLWWVTWKGWAYEIRATWRIAGCCGIIAGLVTRDWWWAAGAAASLALALAWTWWRKNRDKAKRALGAKSRALRDALAARMPRPVPLRPVQGLSAAAALAAGAGAWRAGKRRPR